MMDSLSPLLLCALITLSAVDASAPLRYSEFEAFKAEFSKVYPNKHREHTHLKYFSENLARIERLNAANGSPVFGITQHTDRKPGTQVRFYEAYRL